jgi:hypothetical protein
MISPSMPPIRTPFAVSLWAEDVRGRLVQILARLRLHKAERSHVVAEQQASSLELSSRRTLIALRNRDIVGRE